MTEASRDPEVFLTQVNDAIEDVNSAIGEFVERSANLINSHLTEAGGILGTLVAGPIGGLVGGYLGHELEEQFEEGVDRINETWEAVSETIRQSIGGMLGDPLRMSSIASRYRECVDELGQVQQQIESADNYLAATWTGLAHTAYENTSRNQLEALHGMIESFEGAAQLLDDHQLALVNYWTRQLQNLVSLFTDIVGKTAELGDVGNWFTGGAGVVVSIIATAGESASAILAEAVSYWADLNIGKAGDWQSLVSRVGDRGLQGDRWPDLVAQDRGYLNDPWTPA